MWRTLIYTLFVFSMIRRPPRSTRRTHSFPTRRSSDLDRRRDLGEHAMVAHVAIVGEMRAEQRELEVRLHPGRARLLGLFQRPRPAQQPMRVETVAHPETGSAVEGEAQ